MFTSFTRLSSEEHNGCILDLCYRVRIQKKTICLASKALEVFSWISWPRMDREAIIDFSFNSLKSFVHYFLYFVSSCTENFVQIWLCAVAEAGNVSFF